MQRYALLLATTLSLFVGVAHASAQTPHARVAAATGTLTGVITDATTGKPLAHVLLTLGYLTKGYRLATQTDAHGRYTFKNVLASKGIDAYSFAQGYIYFHGFTAIRAGGTTTYSHVMARDTIKVAHPTVQSFYASPGKGGAPARFGMRANQGNGSFSFEMMAISPDLGRLVVLQHGPGNHYDGALSTAGSKSGTYTFYYVATQNNCLTNVTFPALRVHL
jgi:hypothetical protein